MTHLFERDGGLKALETGAHSHIHNQIHTGVMCTPRGLGIRGMAPSPTGSALRKPWREVKAWA